METNRVRATTGVRGVDGIFTGVLSLSCSCRIGDCVQNEWASVESPRRTTRETPRLSFAMREALDALCYVAEHRREREREYYVRSIDQLIIRFRTLK